MKNFSPSLQSFTLFCFLMAFHLSLGSWLQHHYGMLGIMADQIGILLIPTLIFSLFLHRPWKTLYPWSKPSFRNVLIVFLVTALVIVLTELLLRTQSEIIPPPQKIQKFYEKLLLPQSWHQKMIQVLALAIIPAFCEEMIFRGFLQSVLAEEFSSIGAMVVTSLAFAVAHLNPWYLPFYFLLGFFFSGIRRWQNTLALCFLAHLLNNLYSLFRNSIT